jgi:tetratricopeptide (TPR) repeat protein
MSQVIQETKKCAICGHEQTYMLILSTNEFGYMDLDTRPPEMARSTLRFDIQHCEHCHYVNDNISKKPRWLDEKVLSSQEYLAIANDRALDETAKAFLLACYLNATEGRFAQAGSLALKAAWIFDDNREIEQARSARNKASEYFSRYLSKKEDLGVATMKVDIDRRAGNFETAKEAAQKLFESDEMSLIKEILRYELSLIEVKDTRCHTVGEVKRDE